jgi:hypothetical protein
MMKQEEPKQYFVLKGTCLIQENDTSPDEAIACSDCLITSCPFQGIISEEEDDP